MRQTKIQLWIFLPECLFKPAGVLLTFQPCCPAGWLGWLLDLSLDSPQCCYCKYTWLGRSLHLCCTAVGQMIPADLERRGEKT